MTVADVARTAAGIPGSAPADPLSRLRELEPAEGPWVVERIDDRGGFEGLRAEWDRLLEASPSDGFFLTWEWLYTWWKHLGGERRLALLAVRCGGELAAVAPLALARSRAWRPLPVTSLQLLGTGQVGSDYLDLVARSGDEHRAAGALAEHLGRHRGMIELGQLPAERSSATLVAERLRERGWGALERTTHVCPFIDLAGESWESYFAGLGSSHRANLRRRLRKLEAGFDVRLERVESEAELREAFTVLVELHHRRWADRGGSDAFGGPAVVAFHRELASRCLRRGWLRLYVLRLDGRPAAALYGFLYRGRFLFYQGGFDPAFADWSVGLVTMGLTIRSAIEEGAREYDLLHGDEDYKFLWTNRTRELARLELYPPTAAGLLERRLRQATRTLKGRLRGWRRRAAAAPAASTAGRSA
jgi:CelD/BcsL family acetyltransferase involved in cellulose biosynthesis